VRVLLDAHAFIWWVLDTPSLSDSAREILGDGENDVILSTASCYEIAYKAEIGRLELPEPPEPYIRSRLIANHFRSLPVDLSHALRAATLPWVHRDPFDRILVAQAQVEDLPILTADPAMSYYDVETIW
jgi:PIN domain nuclease of toxin-antitoxin system